jgi:hypothetical protein
MVGRFNLLGSRLIASSAALAVALTAIAAPGQAFAHWGVCYNDPKVWLDDGFKVELGSSIQASPSLVQQITFTLHVPVGASVTQVVYTGPGGGAPEAVNVIADSQAGYLAVEVATSSDGSNRPVTMSVHVVRQVSSWSSGSGSTNQDVTSFNPGT